MDFSLLLFVLIGIAIMILLQWIKYGPAFKLSMILPKAVLVFILGGLLVYFIDKYSIKGALITLSVMGLMYFTYVIPGIKKL